MPVAKTILVVDDDPEMRAMVAEYLADRGLRVAVAADGQEMERVLESEPINLIVLDLKLADEDGLALIRGIRARSTVPIIAVTGQRVGEMDRVVGLELGADDYVTKPFGLRELLARIGAVLRRAEAAAYQMAEEPAAPEQGGPGRYRFGGWELDMRTRRLRSPDGAPVSLTKGEFSLLEAFLRAPRRVLSREQLLAATRLHEDEVYDRSIDVQILRLRRKLEADPTQPELIRTERGVGYIFEQAVEAR